MGLYDKGLNMSMEASGMSFLRVELEGSSPSYTLNPKHRRHESKGAKLPRLRTSTSGQESAKKLQGELPGSLGSRLGGPPPSNGDYKE